MYVPHLSAPETFIERQDHKECATAYTKFLTVISLSGSYIYAVIFFILKNASQFFFVFLELPYLS